MNRRLLSVVSAICVLMLVLACPRAHAKGLQSDSVYFGSTTIGAIAVADFNKDGHPDILTVDGSTGTNNFILLGQPDGTFTPTISFTAAGHLSAVVAGDFNGDGTLDIAVTDSNANTIIVLLGAGDGTFTTKATIPTGASPVAITAADLNGDGKLDLVVANNPAGTVTTYLGVGDGTFTALTPQVAGATDPVAVTAADFNGDGKVDVAVAINTNRMSILGGNGDGTLQAPLTSIIFNEVNPSDIKAVDFNGDGKLDLIVCTLGSVLFIPGNGTLSFGTPVHLASLPGERVAVGDMNGDGHPDLVVARTSGATVLLNNGAGGIASTQDYHGANFPNGIGVADFNGDGKLDLTVSNSFNSTVHVIFGNGNGTLHGALNYDYQTGGCRGSGEGIEIADFNHDGLLDLALTDACNRVTALINNGNFKFTVVLPTNPITGVEARTTVADINHDGNPDIVIIGFSNISVLLGNGDGTFKPELVSNISSSNFHHVIAGDFNEDGKLDLAYTETAPPDATDTTVGILLGNGDGTFQPLSTVLTAGELPNGLAVGDFNGDGHLDLAVLNGGNGFSSTVNIFLGTGAGTFTPGAILSTGAFPIAIQAVDFNKDGKLDLVVANSGNGGAGSEQAFTGQGDGTFIATSNLGVTSSIQSMAIGDFDGDGFPDIAVWANGGEAQVFRHNVAGVFDAPTTLGLGDGGALMGAADLNGGGASDLVALVDGVVAVMPNTGGLKAVLGSSLNPSAFAQSVTFTTSLLPSFPSGLPPASGSVQFSDGASILGTGAVNQSGAAILSTAALTAGTHAVSAKYSGDSNYVAVNLPAISQLVNKAATQTAVTPSVIAAVVGDSITFATVTTPATAGVPSGNVALLEGTNSLGSSAVDASGAASFTLSSLAAGNHSLTVSYSGDQNYLASTSSAVSETIFATPDFQITTATPAVTVRAGQSATIPLNVVAARFNGPVTFSCSGLPNLAACSFAPSTLPLGTGNFSTVLTISTTASSVASLTPIRQRPTLHFYLAALLLPGLAGLVFAGCNRGSRKCGRLLLLLLLFCVTFIVSCGGGGGTPPKTVVPGTPAGTSSVTVQASASGATAASHQVSITLTVTP